MRRRAQRINKSEIDVTASFTLLNGEDFYEYTDLKEMHVDRYALLNDQLTLLSYQVTEKELGQIAGEAMKAINHVENGMMKPKLHIVSMLMSELQNRKETIINRDCLYQMVALLNLSDYEVSNGGKYFPNEHKRKLEAFKKYAPSDDFFLQTKLTIYLPFLNKLQQSGQDSIRDFLQVLNISDRHLKAFNEVLFDTNHTAKDK